MCVGVLHQRLKIFAHAFLVGELAVVEFEGVNRVALTVALNYCGIAGVIRLHLADNDFQFFNLVGDVTESGTAIAKPLVEGTVFTLHSSYALFKFRLFKKVGLESIESNAFYGAGMLHEVVIPSSVRSIGASAFNSSDIKSLVIGCGVETIAENAFAGNANMESVAITAQKPPTAPYTAFSNYSAKLYLQGGQDVIDAYYDAYTCWDRFTGYPMTVAQRIDGEGETSISGEPGDRIQLSATVWPADATLPQIFWRSTNPAVATVDNNGLVTVRKGADEGGCRIIASTLYADGPELVYGVNGSDESGIDVPVADVTVDGPMEVYSINGIRLGDSTEGLAPASTLCAGAAVSLKFL